MTVPTVPTPPHISHYLSSVSLTPRALAKRSPLRYPDNPQIRSLLAKPSWSVRHRLLPKHIRNRRSQHGQLEDRLKQITTATATAAAAAAVQPPLDRRDNDSPTRQRSNRTETETAGRGGGRSVEEGAESEIAEEQRHDEDGEGDTTVNAQTLRHLLRLSALPSPPDGSAAERAMLRDLRSQIHFVRQMQRVNVDGVEPLVAIRDESEQAVNEARVGLDDAEIRAVLAAEEVVGRGTEFERIRRRRENDDDGGGGGGQQHPRMDWDPFELGVGSEKTPSTRRAGRWFVVKKKSSSSSRQE